MAALLILAVACDDGGSSTTTEGPTTTVPAVTSTVAARGPSDTVAETSPTTVASSTTTVPAVRLLDYEIRYREGGEFGDTFIVLVQPGEHTGDELVDVLHDVIERYEAVATVLVVDDIDIMDAILALEDDPQAFTTMTPHELVSVQTHLLVSLREGSRVVFEGPYGELGEFIIGS